MSQKITDSELAIVKALWSCGELSSPQLVEEVQKNFPWDKTTIITLLNRLVKKNLVDQTGAKRFYRYRALITQEEYCNSELQNGFLQFFENKAVNLISYFARNQQLTHDDIAQIKTLLQQIEKEQK